MKNSKKLRKITAGVVCAIIVVGLFVNVGIGTLSAPGIADISILCPLGALGTMLANKVMLPRAVVSLVLVVLFVVVFARAFCGWICPVPLVSKIRDLFSKKPSGRTDDGKAGAKAEEKLDSGVGAEADARVCVKAGDGTGAGITPDIDCSLTDEELAAFKGGACGGSGKDAKKCASCAAIRGKGADARHFVLGGALVSTLAFGFPVFCLVCPIGLTFATVLLVVNLFAHGDVTWSVVVVPALLLAEVVFFRKWCHKLCPLGAFMSLVGKLNRTFVPEIDDGACLETSKGIACGRCGKACEEGIDIRHPELSSAALNECVKCRACVETCPAHAVKMPFLAKRAAVGKQVKKTS